MLPATMKQNLQADRWSSQDSKLKYIAGIEENAEKVLRFMTKQNKSMVKKSRN